MAQVLAPALRGYLDEIAGPARWVLRARVPTVLAMHLQLLLLLLLLLLLQLAECLRRRASAGHDGRVTPCRDGPQPTPEVLRIGSPPAPQVRPKRRHACDQRDDMHVDQTGLIISPGPSPARRHWPEEITCT